MKRLLENSAFLGLDRFRADLAALIDGLEEIMADPVGNARRYQKALDRLPDLQPSIIDCSGDAVRVGAPGDLPEGAEVRLRDSLMELCPWRKGPFSIFGVEVDSEWRSFLKWDRVKDAVSPLAGRKILDIGSSNGYYMFRMADANPLMVLGVEPQYTFYYQYLAIQRYSGLSAVHCLPITFDRLPVMENYFDTVFCMGILYHRKSPLDMLGRIHDILVPGGELVLETLIIETGDETCLCPSDRYAKMRNVFFIPSLTVLAAWLKRSGFTGIRVADVTATKPEEQRRTPWIQTESLTDFLDPGGPGRTVEGYPAPVRAILTARAV